MELRIRDTVCKTCCFAEWSHDQQTQIDCQLGMLDNAEKAGLEVLAVFDDDKAFNVISNRQCMYHRTLKWADGKNNLEAKAEKELEIHFQSIIFTDALSTEEEIFHSIESLANQTLKPNYVIVIRHHLNKVRPLRIKEYLEKQHFKLWKLENPNEWTYKERQGRKLIDLVLHKKVHPFISTFIAGQEIPLNFYETIRFKMFREFFQFGIITNSLDTKHDEPIHGVVVPKTIFDYYGNTLSEIEKCLINDKTQNGILEVQTVFPTLQLSL